MLCGECPIVYGARPSPDGKCDWIPECACDLRDLHRETLSDFFFFVTLLLEFSLVLHCEAKKKVDEI